MVFGFGRVWKKMEKISVRKIVATVLRARRQEGSESTCNKGYA
jgi:hypothetical protein